MDNQPEELDQSGLDRRAVLRRGAVLGGSLVWTVPAVQSIAGAAFAAGSPLCDASITGTSGGVCQKIVYTPTRACCDCVAANAALPLPLAIAFCAFTGQCVQDPTSPQPC